MTLFRKAALAAAVVWTAGIFIACLWPGRELPHSDIPFIDKWTHLVLFGGFSLLWLLAFPGRSVTRLVTVAAIATALGCLVEGLQASLPDLGRSGDLIDAVADMVGGVLGALAYWGIRQFPNSPIRQLDREGPHATKRDR